MALRAVRKHPGVGGAGEIDGFDANGIAVANKDVAGDATRNGGRVLQQHVLVHVRESAGVGGFDAVARTKYSLLEGYGSRCCFLFYEEAVEGAQLVGVGRVAAFETYVDFPLVGAGAEEADGARFVEGEGFKSQIVVE